jgi:hypothetical protein
MITMDNLITVPSMPSSWQVSKASWFVLRVLISAGSLVKGTCFHDVYAIWEDDWDLWEE